MATPVPIEILLGVYLGLLTGIIPALVAGSLGFLFRYVTGVTVPALAVVVLAVAIAGVNGGLLGLIDPTISQSPRLLVAVLVVLMLSLYAHSQGDKLGASLPRRFSLRRLREQTLSADVVDFVGSVGQVTVRPAGEIRSVEGYPPLPADLREELRGGSWRFPADLPLPELETRLARRLRTEYDLEAVDVSIDAGGRAAIDAAPPSGGLSRRVPPGERAASVAGLVPTGIARGERVAVDTGTDTVEGTVVSARSSPDAPNAEPDAASQPTETDGGDADHESPAPRSTAPTTTGGEGRVTLSTSREGATALVRAERGRIAVRPRDSSGEFALLSTLRRAGKRVRSVVVAEDAPLVGAFLDPAAIREEYGVTVLAVNRADAGSGERWTFDLSSPRTVEAGDELFVVGAPDAVAGFDEVVA